MGSCVARLGLRIQVEATNLAHATQCDGTVAELYQECCTVECVGMMDGMMDVTFSGGVSHSARSQSYFFGRVMRRFWQLRVGSVEVSLVVIDHNLGVM